MTVDKRRSGGMIPALTALMLLIFSGSAVAQGTTGFEILRVQTQPRGSALAGALVADEGQVENLFYNPAGLAALQERVVSAGYMNYLLDIQSGHVEYADATKPWGVWGVMLSYTNYGDFEARNTAGVQLPDFNATDVVLAASFARKLKAGLNVGGSVKFVQSDIAGYTARALALDLGGQYTFIENQLRLGWGIYNLGGTLKAYDEYKDSLPLTYQVGIWGIPRGLPASLFLSLTLYQEYADNYSLRSVGGSEFVDFLKEFYLGFGAEFHPIEQFALRLGYNTIGLDQRVGTKKDFMAGICLGIGFDMTLVKMDYGLASHGELGFVQRIALSKTF